MDSELVGVLVDGKMITVVTVDFEVVGLLLMIEAMAVVLKLWECARLLVLV